MAALLAAGADKDAVGSDGQTPLHLAAAHGREACVAALLAAGANFYLVDQEQQTPLDKAKATGNFAMVELLTQVGCGLNQLCVALCISMQRACGHDHDFPHAGIIL